MEEQSSCAPIAVDTSGLAQGLVTLRNPWHTHAPPVDIAVLQLSHVLQSHQLQTQLSKSITPNLVRIEIPVCPTTFMAHLQPPALIAMALLEWLLLQLPAAGSRVAFASRCGTFGVAGVGVCSHLVAPPAPCETGFSMVQDQLRGLHPHLRYIGGCSVASGQLPGGTRAPPSKWPSAFQGFSFVMPRVDLALTLNGSNSISATLAVHLNLQSDALDPMAVVQRETSAALAVLGQLQWSAQRELHSRLPPPVSVSHSPEFPEYSAAVGRALVRFETEQLQKVVLARQTTLAFTTSERCPTPADPVAILLAVCRATVDTTRYLFYFEPPSAEGQNHTMAPAFMSISPERLCRVQGQQVETEAIAGTWARADFEKLGQQEEDPSSPSTYVLRDPKITNEHTLVSECVTAKLKELSDKVEVSDVTFLRMKHLVHLKQSFCVVAEGSMHSIKLMHWIVQNFHPTPAICGTPTTTAGDFIAEVEPFDRGWYAAPVGYLTADGGELLVALRSALSLPHATHQSGCPSHTSFNPTDSWELVLYAGAGLVKGSVAEAEWKEMDVKMKQYMQLFDTKSDLSAGPSLLASFDEAPNINALWSMTIVEELVRLGVTHFVICPGSRSTPLVVAVVRHPGTTYVVCNDERGAAYYAVGYGRAVLPGGKVHPACIIVTSGTAVANLLPGVVEASQSHIPLLVLSADRPADLREIGASQTIIQPGIFSHYVAWEKDFPPPCLEYSLEALLSDLDYAGTKLGIGGSTGHGEPVHLNFQFRENLAPDSGPIRGAPHLPTDDFVGRDRTLMLSSPSITRWRQSGKCFTTYSLSKPGIDLPTAVVDTLTSPGAVIVLVVGELRSYEDSEAVAWLAETLQAPVLADVCASLQDHRNGVDVLLSCHVAHVALRGTTVVLRVGGPIISARLEAWLSEYANLSNGSFVVVDPRPGTPRRDAAHLATDYIYLPLPTLTQAICSLQLSGKLRPPSGTQIVLRKFLSSLGSAAAEGQTPLLDSSLTEPAIAQLTCSAAAVAEASVYLSSSMPCRDADIFGGEMGFKTRYVCNRGASGIDGVIASAIGYAVATLTPVVLLIGDLATIHDLNALVLLRSLAKGENCRLQSCPTVHVVCVNNAGGAIFRFLPIAKHADVFHPCFDSPHTKGDGASPMDLHGVATALLADSTAKSEAGLIASQVTTTDEFGQRLTALVSGQLPAATFTEVIPALDHTANVDHHRALAQAADTAGEQFVESKIKELADCLSWCSQGTFGGSVVVFLHGWMGSKEDWRPCWDAMQKEETLANVLCLAVDLPGHGGSLGYGRSPTFSLPPSLLYSMETMAKAVRHLLSQFISEGSQQVTLVGYSLGGRIAMQFLSAYPSLVSGIVLLGSHPGLPSSDLAARSSRSRADARLATELQQYSTLDSFLHRWYGPRTVFADLVHRRREVFDSICSRRGKHPTAIQGYADVLQYASLGYQNDMRPALQSWYCPGRALVYAHGELDTKYCCLTNDTVLLKIAQFRCVPDVGHALIAEADGHAITQLLHDAIAKPSPPIAHRQLEIQITDVKLHSFSLPLVAPLVVAVGGSKGTSVAERRGRLMLLSGRTRGGCSAVGIGELCPLPGLPPGLTDNGIDQLFAELQCLSPVLVGKTISTSISHMGSNDLQTSTVEALLAEVRQLTTTVCQSPHAAICGCIEQALVHLFCRLLEVPLSAFLAVACGTQSPFRESHVHLNLLAVRGEAAQGGPYVLKCKVGDRDPSADAAMVKGILASDCTVVVRVDANQAWTVPQAVSFFSALGDTGGRVQYIEEPLQQPTKSAIEQLMQGLEEAHIGAAIRPSFVLDESLLQLSDEQVDELMAVRCSYQKTENDVLSSTPLKHLNGAPELLSHNEPAEGSYVFTGLVLKPAALGVLRCLELMRRWPPNRATHTVTSIFDSGVGLCFGTILAAVRAAPSPEWSHGLSTASRLQGDITHPVPFSSIIHDFCISVAACEHLLSSTADHWWHAASSSTGE